MGFLVETELAHLTAIVFNIIAIHMVHLIILTKIICSIGENINKRIVRTLKEGNHWSARALWCTLFQNIVIGLFGVQLQ